MERIKKKPFDKKLLFCLCVIALPVLQFMLCYVYVNFNSFILAFTKYDKITDTTSFAGFDNFELVFTYYFDIAFYQ